MGYEGLYGKGKGCDFAKGISHPAPEFCASGNSAQCEFYHQFGGYCFEGEDPLFQHSSYACKINRGAENGQYFGSGSSCYEQKKQG